MQRIALSLLLASVMLVGASAGSQAQRPGDPPPAAQAPPSSQQQPGLSEPRPAPLPQVPGVTVPAPPEADSPDGGGGCRYQQRPLELIV